jgi:hypothetical protein
MMPASYVASLHWQIADMISALEVYANMGGDIGAVARQSLGRIGSGVTPASYDAPVAVVDHIKKSKPRVKYTLDMIAAPGADGFDEVKPPCVDVAKSKNEKLKRPTKPRKSKLEKILENPTTVTELKYSPAFMAFWKAYPRKVNMFGSAQKFSEIEAHDLPLVQFAAEEFARASVGTEQKHIAHPSTWLNQRRFEDMRERFTSLGIEVEITEKPDSEEPNEPTSSFDDWIDWARPRIVRVSATPDELLNESKRTGMREALLRDVWRMHMVNWLMCGQWQRTLPDVLALGKRGFPALTMKFVLLAKEAGRVVDDGSKMSVTGNKVGAEFLARAIEIR